MCAILAHPTETTIEQLREAELTVAIEKHKEQLLMREKLVKPLRQFDNVEHISPNLFGRCVAHLSSGDAFGERALITSVSDNDITILFLCFGNDKHHMCRKLAMRQH